MSLSIIEIECEGFEHVYKISDKETGLNGYVAIHNSKLGPAVGGTRFYPYGGEDEALADVLNLAGSMTSKCAIAGIKKGGGKGVIIGDPRHDKTKALLKSYAQAIGKLKGAFYTGEDVGVTEEDVQYMLTIAPYFIGKSNAAGDPSEYASLSVYTLMKAAAKKIFGEESLKGRTIGIKGLGKVGRGLVTLLQKEGTKILGTDIDPIVIEQVRKEFPKVKIVGTNLPRMEMDIYAPCALGNEFTKTSVESLAAKIICGGANNQIIEPGIDELLNARGVLYVPDYLANAGGLINVVDELEPGGYDRSRVLERISQLTEIFNTLFQEARIRRKTLLDMTNAKVSGIMRINREVKKRTILGQKA